MLLVTFNKTFFRPGMRNGNYGRHNNVTWFDLFWVVAKPNINEDWRLKSIKSPIIISSVHKCRHWILNGGFINGQRMIDRWLVISIPCIVFHVWIDTLSTPLLQTMHTIDLHMGLLPDTQNFVLRMRRECRERFPRHRLQRKPLVSDPDLHHGTCVTHVPWCMSGR